MSDVMWVVCFLFARFADSVMYVACHDIILEFEWNCIIFVNEQKPPQNLIKLEMTDRSQSIRQLMTR